MTAWIELEGIMPSKINQTKKYKCHMISLTRYMWNLKNSINEQTKQKQIFVTQTDGCWREGGLGGLGEKGKGIKKYKLVVIK